MPDALDLITFAVGDDFFGIDLSDVEEVAADPALEVNKADGGMVTGFSRHRDRPIPVINLGELLGLEDDRGGVAGGGGRVIVVRLAGGSWVGLKVDGAAEVRRGVPAPAPAPALYAGGTRAALVRGLIVSGGRLVPLLDPHRLLTDDELRKLRDVGAAS